MRWNAALIRAMLHRENGAANAATLIGVVIIGLIAAGASTFGVSAGVEPPPMLRNFEIKLAFALAMVACIRLLQRPAEDQQSGWIHAYCANTGGRGDYAVALAGAVIIPSAAAYLVAIMSYSTGMIALGGELAGDFPGRAAAGVLLIICAGFYSLVVGMLARDLSLGFTAVILSFVIPLGAIGVHILRTDTVLPFFIRRALVAHLPPLRMLPTLPYMMENVVYACAAASVAWLLAQRVVGRHG